MLLGPASRQVWPVLAAVAALALAGCSVGTAADASGALQVLGHTAGSPGHTAPAPDTGGGGLPTDNANTIIPIDPNAGAQVPTVACPATGTIAVAPRQELVLTSLAVVEDPVRSRWTGALTDADDGAWHLGRLLTEIAGNQDAPRFVEAWLRSFATVQVINGQSVTDADAKSVVPDAAIRAGTAALGPGNLLSLWPRVPRPDIADPNTPSDPTSAAGPKNTPTMLDLTQAPFILLAVVNRLDLRDPAAGVLGELRFVFQGQACIPGGGQPNTCAAGQVANESRIILEYKVRPSATYPDAQAWAAGWHQLTEPGIDQATMLARLATLTHAITAAGAAPDRPNGSAIGQVRTSQVEFFLPPWIYRQFELDPGTGALVGTPVGMTPARQLDGTPTLQGFLLANQAAILAGDYTVPSVLLGGASGLSGRPRGDGTYDGDFATTSSWGAAFGTGVDPTARYVFALNTCNGCHGVQTNNNATTAHIRTRRLGTESGLSALFTGVGAGVAGSAPLPLPGARLGELDRRGADMAAVLCGGAATQRGGGLVLLPGS